MRHYKPLRIALWSLLSLLMIVLLVAGGALIFILNYDWNHARPWLNGQVSASIGREFAIRGDLAVRFLPALPNETGWRHYVPRPQIVANDVQIANPAWSSVGAQMASAQRVAVTVQLLPLLQKQVIITALDLDAPRLALERRADGSNSWQLATERKIGSPWQVDIDHLRLSDGKLRYLDRSIELDMLADIASIESTLPTADTTKPAPPAQKFGLQFTLSGKYHRAPVSGSGKAGALLALEDAHTVYPVVASVQLGSNKIAIDGTLTDPRAPRGIDLQLTLGGVSMSELYPLTGVLLPVTPPYSTHGRLIGKREGALWNWTYRNFTGRVGESDLAGTLQYLPRLPRPLLRGELSSQQLRLQDLGATIGADSNVAKQARGQSAVQPAGKALPVEPFDTAKWGAMDADIQFRGKRLVRTHDIPLQDMTLELHLKDKVLSLTSLNFGFAGGQIASTITLDARQPVIAAQLKMTARHLKIRKLFPKLQSTRASFGEINGDAVLSGNGNSVALMLASANGDLTFAASEGSISKLTLELASLNLANAVFVKLFGDRQIHLNCLASDFVVHNGDAKVRRFIVDTDEAVIDVTGEINLAHETLQLDIHPKTKVLRLFSLRTPLYVKGSFTQPDIGLYKGPLVLKAGAAVVLATVSPLAALLPLVTPGKTPDTNCPAELDKVAQSRRSPKTGKVAARVTRQQPKSVPRSPAR